jgi:dihydrofolate reductase
MATVGTELSMSLDGFITDPAGGVDHIFDWYGNGPVTITMPSGEMEVHVSPASAVHLRDGFERVAALVTGRRTFDVTNGWNGRHTMDAPVFVVTHEVPEGWPRDDAPFTFVTEGVARAVELASEVAGDGLVGVAAADVVQQCINLGLLDEITVNLTPVLLGSGVRLFDHLSNVPVPLDDPVVIEGTGVTHLRYRVQRT